jgi:hypothetical protein
MELILNIYEIYPICLSSLKYGKHFLHTSNTITLFPTGTITCSEASS